MSRLIFFPRNGPEVENAPFRPKVRKLGLDCEKLILENLDTNLKELLVTVE